MTLGWISVDVEDMVLQLYDSTTALLSSLPATVQNPNTATTFHALHHFQLLSFESKCLVYEFYQTLVCESDNTSHRRVKVCELVKIKCYPR